MAEHLPRAAAAGDDADTRRVSRDNTNRGAECPSPPPVSQHGSGGGVDRCRSVGGIAVDGVGCHVDGTRHAASRTAAVVRCIDVVIVHTDTAATGEFVTANDRCHHNGYVNSGIINIGNSSSNAAIQNTETKQSCRESSSGCGGGGVEQQ